MDKTYLKSPLNYTGGKYKLLPQLMEYFPKDIDTFVDVFCGGLDVSLNVNANKIISNDKERHLIELYRDLQCIDTELTMQQILNNISKYELSKENKEGYLELRQDFNNKKTWDKFYTLICYSFNHSIRFNKNGDFNMPFGKNRSSFNPTLQKRFSDFCNKIKDEIYYFTSVDFETLLLGLMNFNELDNRSFVYLDPPYLITTAHYNESGAWTSSDEKRLYNLLNELTERKIKWGLSNVVINQNGTNEILKEFMKDYKVLDINAKYSNCNYQKKNKSEVVREVYVYNY